MDYSGVTLRMKIGARGFQPGLQEVHDFKQPVISA